MQFRTLRLSLTLVMALLILIFFVPLVPYKTQAVCFSLSCGLTPVSGFYTGYNSLGILFFHWGASLDTSFGVATYSPPIIMMNMGGGPSQLTAFGVLFFILLPIFLFIAILLSPEEWRIISAGLSRLQRWRDNQPE